MSENIFGGFEEEWAGTEAAARGQARGRVPEGIYKVMLTTVDPGDGVPVDHEVIDNRERGGSIGVKIFLEVLSPEKVGEIPTKGGIIEHVFWVTGKTLPYIKRDTRTIFGKDLARVSDLLSVKWAGRTAEVGVKEEEYNGYINSRVNFWNPWKPEASSAKPAAATVKKAKTGKPQPVGDEEAVAF